MGLQLAKEAGKISDKNKGEDILILEVTQQIEITDYFVLVTCQSKPHLKFLNRELNKKLKEKLDRNPLAREGEAEQGWLLADYGEVIIHLFTREEREFYDLENLWADARRHPVEPVQERGSS